MRIVLDIMQILYLAILLLIGFGILFVRRKANGTKSLYKLLLILTGIVCATIVTQYGFFDLERHFLQTFSMFLLIVLLFELSTRLNSDNIIITRKDITLLFAVLAANILIISIVCVYLLDISATNAFIIAVIISSIEYFMVSEIKKEGDMINPFIILFAFSLLYYDSSQAITYSIAGYLQYLLIGLGMGVLTGIIVFKTFKHHHITWIHEIALIAAAVSVYIFTEYMGGSGIFAVMILGIFFGNSHVRKRIQMASFSPFVFKSVEIFIFLITGFVVAFSLELQLILGALAIFATYVVIRFIIICISHKTYSLQNKFLLTIAPKGMVFAAMILVLASYSILSSSIISLLFIILVISLLVSAVYENIEQRRIRKLDIIFEALKNIRFGRKRDLHKK